MIALKVVEINMCAYGSTGHIMLQVAEAVRRRGGEAYTFSTPLFTTQKRSLPDIEGHTYYGSYAESTVHYLLGRLTTLNGFFSRFATWRLLRRLKKLNPDVIHIHNLHSFCINLPMLFRYFEKSGTPVVWTLHDCWSFTGHCAHFTMARCEKWKAGCHACPHYHKYPKVTFDNTRFLYRQKKKIFTRPRNMTLVTPSLWLHDLVKQSFLQKYPVRVINNGIRLDVFCPGKKHKDLSEKAAGHYLVLGVAFDWGESKGLDAFVALSARLPGNYRILLVGTNEAVEAKLPQNMLTLRRTEDQAELAEIYRTADVFVNLTREDTFPTVNIEALACGTPVVTYKTGGSPEILDASCGSVVEVDDIEALVRETRRVCEDTPFAPQACRARAEEFGEQERFEEYVDLFASLTEGEA